ncbi:MAG TPA: NAD-dependent epimerase/dehydratase family protein [Solirubrobacteraceae bacterium]|nr:NAD-dependent epimerase/dehydratase family protein [Solirubrobacteraceae bacterium]
MASPPDSLSVAVTGPTGTFGFGLMPLLEDEPRVREIVGIARRPFDPAAHGWTKMRYRRGDVRDPNALREAFAGIDVVVHLAFMITGTASPATIRAINIDGTVNAFRAARDAGAQRFVYASSVAAYGFHPDNPVGMTEDWPTRPADRLFYAQEKAELEHVLQQEAAAAPAPALFLLRPPIVLGPHAVGAKGTVPAPVAGAGRRLLEVMHALPIPLPMLAPDVELQFIHEQDVGRALLRCALGEGPPGAYNIAGEGVLTGADIIRELGLAPVPLPGGLVRRAARAAAALPRPPFVPPAADWVEAFSHPAIMDTTKARTQLGWTPRYTGLEALRETIRRTT